jgi:hypothetical protein
MKNKILVGIALIAFAFVIMFNVTIIDDKEDSDIALEQLTIMAKANLGEWMSDTFGGNWKATDHECEINGTRVIHQTSCSIFVGRYGGSASCDCTTSVESYKITYKVSKCTNGRGSCWYSQNC